MSHPNWASFTVRIPISANPDTVYACWATRRGIESWFLRTSEYKNPNGIYRDANEPVQKGDSYRWLWYGWPDDTVEHGEILDCNNKDRFQFSFGKAGNCTVTILVENEQTLLQLIQEGIPDDDQGKMHWHVGCKTGWTFYLTNLKSILEGGIDLRNRDMVLKGVLNS